MVRGQCQCGKQSKELVARGRERSARVVRGQCQCGMQSKEVLARGRERSGRVVRGQVGMSRSSDCSGAEQEIARARGQGQVQVRKEK